MICPGCRVQMHQKDGIGGGESNDDRYTTWEVKECPKCGRLVREYYSAEVLDSKKFFKLKRINHLMQKKHNPQETFDGIDDAPEEDYENVIEV